jgi:hypothetical protein
MPFPKDIINLVKSKINKKRTEFNITQNLTDKIDPGAGNIGAKNYNFYYKNIKDKVKAGDTTGAADYSRQEQLKVQDQMRKDKERRTSDGYMKKPR